jgi:hypothetical protein
MTPVIHTYRAAESGLYVNSYLVEAESGVVVVDTNLLVSDVEALRARLRALNKPLLAILVTHLIRTTSTACSRWFRTRKCRCTPPPASPG